MKHIKEIIAERQTSLFTEPEEKGSREWSVFDPVRVNNNSGGMFRVSVPRRAVVLREPHHVLRIVYPMRHAGAY